MAAKPGPTSCRSMSWQATQPCLSKKFVTAALSPPGAWVAESQARAETTATAPATITLLDATRFDTEQLLGHRQVTDAYLLGLAAASLRRALLAQSRRCDF